MARKDVTSLPRSIPIPIFLPVVLTALLFGLTIFLIILPLVEEKLMEGKREVIRELVESAWHSLDDFAEKEREGQLSREVAQERAIAHIRGLRYGQDLKDYFWINDMQPRIVMHPYRSDLEGRDVADFTDPSGKHIFVAFVETVQANNAGYVDYAWQWLDDPQRIVPKISYVKGFSPWGWIIGTGIYVEDVHAEISTITHNLTLICLGILALIICLSAYTLWHGAWVTREKRRAEEQSKLRREQLFQAAKMVSLGTLVSGVAHEINNPITSIMLNAPNLEKVWQAAMPILDGHVAAQGDFPVAGSSYTQLRERLPQMLASIGNDARRVRDIVSDLKDFAREKPPEMHDAVDVSEVVQKAIGLASNLIGKSTQHFTTTLAPDLPTFKGNAQRIEQVVINLLVNACQALPADDRPLSVATYTECDPSVFQVIIMVSDGGTGIAPEVLQHIKDPFFTTKRDKGGTGLGLAISDKIVSDHGGSLEFDSRPGQGTTVRAIFPLQPNQTNHNPEGDR